MSACPVVFDALAPAVGAPTGHVAANRAVPAVVAVLTYTLNGSASSGVAARTAGEPFTVRARPLVLGLSPVDTLVPDAHRRRPRVDLRLV